MDLVVALYAYLVTVLIILIFLWWARIRSWSALILALISGFILLNILLPPCEAHCYVDCGSAYALYIFIQFATVAFVFIYAALMALQDRIPCCPTSKTVCSSLPPSLGGGSGGNDNVSDGQSFWSTSKD